MASDLKISMADVTEKDLPSPSLKASMASFLEDIQALVGNVHINPFLTIMHSSFQ